MSTSDTGEFRALAHLSQDHRRTALAVGVGMMALAAAAAAFPAETTLAVGAASGWLLWLAGALMLGVSLVLFNGRLRLLGVAAALPAVALGVYLTLNPTLGALAAALMLAAALAMDGGFQLAAALHLRPLAAWRWLFASSVTSLTAAALLGAGWPERSPHAVAYLLGLAFLTTGAALVATSLARPASRR